MEVACKSIADKTRAAEEPTAGSAEEAVHATAEVGLAQRDWLQLKDSSGM